MSYVGSPSNGNSNIMIVEIVIFTIMNAIAKVDIYNT